MDTKDITPGEVKNATRSDSSARKDKAIAVFLRTHDIYRFGNRDRLRRARNQAKRIAIARLPLCNYKFGWLQGARELLKEKKFWLRGLAMFRMRHF